MRSLLLCVVVLMWLVVVFVFLCQAEDGIRDLVRSRGLGDVYKRQVFGGAESGRSCQRCHYLQACFRSRAVCIHADDRVAVHFQSQDEVVDGLSHRIEGVPVSYTHLRAHETVLDIVCRLLLEKKTTHKKKKHHSYH